MKKLLVIVASFLTQISLAQDFTCDSLFLKNGKSLSVQVQELSRRKLVYFLCCEECRVPRELNRKDIDTIIYAQRALNLLDSKDKEVDEPALTSFKNYSFYLEGTLPYGSWNTSFVSSDPSISSTNISYTTVGIGINIGNKWYFSNNKRYKPGVLVNYARAEFTIKAWYVDPLQIGWANIWQKSNGRFVEFNLYGGARLNFDNIHNPGFSLTTELKYRVKGALLGIAFDFGRESHHFSVVQKSITSSGMLRFSAGFYK